MDDDTTTSRRRLLELAGVTASVTTITAIAGCSDETSDDSDNDGTGDSDDENDNGDDESKEEESKEDEEEPKGDEYDPERPVLFVHGGMGSATQFESQAMRFASNGYPQAYLAVYEYDSIAFEEIQEEIIAGVYERIEQLRAETGAERVDVMGHSRGTAVMQAFLADPDRADLVANYVNIDGREADAPPGGVRTLAVWALGNEESEIGGAENVFFPQGHVEVTTSAETFGAVFEFLTGEEPTTTRIEPEPADEITLSGRAAVFPRNIGLEDGKLEVYAINPKTGSRLETVATTKFTEGGYWGPIDVDGTAHHEFVVRRGDGVVQHLYRQPELRSNAFVRLLVGEEGGLTDELIDRGPDHAALVISRDMEWWGDQEDSDDLLIDGTDVINAATAPLEAGIVSPMVFDADADGESDVSQPIPAFQAVPFLTGIDLHIPAADPPDDLISIVSRQRGTEGLERAVKVPNWPSDDHRISIQFPDHGQVR